MLSSASTASALIDEVVPLAQITADINAIPRHKRQPVSQLKEDVSTHDCLQILYLMACGCMREIEDMVRFWRFMRFDFILMILSINQPLDDIQIMLSLLHTSVLEDSFATIVSVGAHDQRVCEKHVINNMTLLLIDVPRVAEGEQLYDTIEVAELRLQVLDLIEKMCDKRHGGEALAVDPYAIGRLVRVMNDELDSMYDYTYGQELKYILYSFSRHSHADLPITEQNSSTAPRACFFTSHPFIQSPSTCEPNSPSSLVGHIST